SRQEYRLLDSAHADRSSEVFVSDDGNAVLKSRPEQGEDKFMREFLALHVWSHLLDHYNQEAGDDFTIESPRPIAVNFEERSIYMSLLPGEAILQAYASPRAEIGRVA